MNPLEDIAPYPAGRRVVAWVVVAAGVLALCGWLRHALLWSNLYDLGIFDQAIYLISRGLPPVSTTLGFPILGDHASFILYPIALLYRLRPTVDWLFILQGLGLAAGALPIAALARDVGLEASWQAALAGAYLLYPAVFNVALYDFHPETLAVPALLWAVVWGRQGRWFPFVCACLWAMSCKEVLTLTIAAIGLTLLVPDGSNLPSPRRRRVSAVTAMGLGVTGFLLDVGFVIPHFSGHGPAALDRFSDLGGPSLWQVSEGMFTHPGVVAAKILSPAFAVYGLMLIAPLAAGLRMVDGIALLPALPMLVLNGLSAVPYQRDLLHQYTVPIFPFLFVWLVRSVARLQRDGRRPWLRPSMIVASAGAGFIAMAKVGYFATVFTTHLPYRSAAFSAMALIPSDASVLAASDLAPHLSHRLRLDEPEGGTAAPDAMARAAAYRYILLDPQQPNVAAGEVAPAVFARALAADFRTVYAKDGVCLLERRQSIVPTETNLSR
ncbi:MAG: DUF2079 domain-containing protein [Cyanobacteria bacterium REEB65]|nr:DUF2079 domain-containing protein [Cyanobacteria bacterium REEB65]